MLGAINCILFFLTFLHNYQSLPVAVPKGETTKQAPKVYINAFDGLPYGNYVKEITQALQNDKYFMEHVAKVENNNSESNITDSLHKAHPDTRKLLNEIKKIELRRLLDVEHELQKLKHRENIDIDKLKFDREIYKKHINHANEHEFTEADLNKLIENVQHDLDEIDKYQNKKYKEHEMEAKAKEIRKLKDAKSEDEREKLKKELKDSRDRHLKHEKLHSPGSEEQLKDIWEMDDGMSRDSYDPKTFFNLHDINGDGFLDLKEVEALMQRELDKIYDEANPDDDPYDRLYEVRQMRQSFFKTVDADRDGIVTEGEFLVYAKTPEFKRDFGWKAAEEAEEEDGGKGGVYSEEELKDYMTAHEQLTAPGTIPSPTTTTTSTVKA